MRSYTRREMLIFAGSAAAASISTVAYANDKEQFAAEAARMRQQAIAAGDQPYGAIIVLDGRIVGFGPSRVVLDRNPDAHAERVALWDARRQLGSPTLTGAVIYATSQPCAICQKALAQANIARMYVGSSAVDAGKPGR
jgi:tRNA(Arg) A34 adenosine deaminase TadA